MSKKLISLLICFIFLVSNIAFASEDNSQNLKSYLYILVDTLSAKKVSSEETYLKIDSVIKKYLKDENGINSLSEDYEKIIYILDKENADIKKIDKNKVQSEIKTLNYWSVEDRYSILDKINNKVENDSIKKSIDDLVVKYSKIINISFNDIKNHWAKDYIIFMVDKNIANGYQDNTFKPDVNITRGEFCKLLVNSLNLTVASYNNSFKDLGNHWAKDYIQTAYNIGFVKGFDGEFKPDKNITRSEMATMIGRTLDNNIKPSSVKFSDDKQIPLWANEYIYKCVSKGLVKGDNNMYRPNDNTTRAEAITILYRLIN